MAWKIVFTRRAKKDFSELDHQTQLAISRYLDQVLVSDSPYQLGAPLVGNLSGFWRYRVGKYRIICEIQDEQLIIELISIGKRDKVYL